MATYDEARDIVTIFGKTFDHGCIGCYFVETQYS
jgi:hypothetical protein